MLRSLRPLGTILGLFLAVLIALALAVGSADAATKKKKKAAKTETKYAAIVVDAHDGKVIYSRNADAFRYPASLTKMMTLYIVFEEMEAGRLKSDDTLRASSQAAKQPPSKLGLKLGETLTLDQAIRALVTKSANDVAVVLAEHVEGSERAFARRMTETARKLGMSRTTFRNASGLPDPNQRSSARDVAILGRALMIDHAGYYDYFSVDSFSWRGADFANHNKLLGRYDGTTGLKTGYTRASGFNLATSVERDGYTLIAVVLGGRTARSRDDHMIQLLDLQFARLRKTPLLASKGPLMPGVPGPREKPSSVATLVPSAPATAASLNAGMLAGLTSTNPVETAPLAPVTGDPIGDAIAVIDNSAPPATAAELASLSTDEAAGEGDTGLEAADARINDWLGEDKYWSIQIGAFAAMESAAARLSAATALAPEHLSTATPAILPSAQGSSTLYRARFGPFEEADARAACTALSARGIQCVAVSDGEGPTE